MTKLREAAYCIDELHGGTHVRRCRFEFLGSTHANIPSYRAGARLPRAACCMPTAPVCYTRTPNYLGVQAEHLNAFIARLANTCKHESSAARLETLYEFLADHSYAQLQDLPRSRKRRATGSTAVKWCVRAH